MSDKATPPTIRRRVLIGTGWLTGWRMASRLIGFISLLVLTQILVPTDFGLVALASSVSASVDSLSQIGVRDALIRLRDDTRDHYDTAFTFQLLRGLLTGCVIALLSTRANAWMGDPRLQPILLTLAALAVFSGLENIGTVRLARELDFRTQILLQAVPRLAGFAVTVSVALLTRSYWALIAGTAASKLLGVGLTYATAPHRPRLSLQGWRYLMHFSLWTWAASVASIVWSRSDPFLIGPVLGTALLGLYVISNEIAILPITELIEPVCGAMFPGFAMAHRAGGVSRDLALKVAGALALCAIPFAIGVSACSGYLVAGLLGPGWAAAQPIIAITAWLCAFSPFSYVCGSVLSAQGHVRRAFFCIAAAATVRIAVVAAVRYAHDLELIAVANVACVGVESSLFIWQLTAAGNYGLRPLCMTLCRAAVAAVLTAGVLYAVPGTWAATSLTRAPAMIEGGLIGVLAFSVFFAAQVTLWHLMGRPAGAEQEGWAMLGQAKQRLWARAAD